MVSPVSKKKEGGELEWHYISTHCMVPAMDTKPGDNQ